VGFQEKKCRNCFLIYYRGVDVLHNISATKIYFHQFPHFEYIIQHIAGLPGFGGMNIFWKTTVITTTNTESYGSGAQGVPHGSVFLVIF